MFRFLSLMFLAGAVLELASLIWVGSKIGLLPTLLLLFAGGVTGVALFRSAGANAATILRSSIQDQKIVESLAGTTMVRLVAGILFIVPGFFSDALGVLLLVLPVSRWIGVKSQARAGRPSSPFRDTGQFGRVIEGEAVEVRGEDKFPPVDEKLP